MLTNAAASIILTYTLGSDRLGFKISFKHCRKSDSTEHFLNISYILTKWQGRHDSDVQKSCQGRHLWLSRWQINSRRVNDLLLDWRSLMKKSNWFKSISLARGHTLRLFVLTWALFHKIGLLIPPMLLKRISILPKILLI